MHRDCHIWQKDPCGRKGICWDYDTNSMSKSMTIFGLVVTGKLIVSELLRPCLCLTIAIVGRDNPAMHERALREATFPFIAWP